MKTFSIYVYYLFVLSKQYLKIEKIIISNTNVFNLKFSKIFYLFINMGICVSLHVP